MKSIAVTPGEYLVNHVVNSKLTTSSAGHMTGQPLTPVSSTVTNGVGPPARPVLAGFNVRPTTMTGKDRDIMLPQRRDVVVLLAAGPTPTNTAPRHPGTISSGTEPNYVYYTAIPQFCAVTTSACSSPTVVLSPNSGALAGGIVNTVCGPGTVVRGLITPGTEAPDVAVSGKSIGNFKELVGNTSAVVLSTIPNRWTSNLETPGIAAQSDVVVSQFGATKVCSDLKEGGPSKDKQTTDATVVTTLDPVPKSASPALRDSSGLEGVESGAPSTTSKTFTCTECSRDFSSEKYLNMHMSLHLQLAPKRGTAETSLSPSLLVGISDVPAAFPMVLTSQQQLIMAPPPIRRTKTTTIGTGGASCTSQWTCQICEKTFAQNSNYKNHIRTHSNERPFVCEICAIGFKERYHLKKHVLFKHTSELREECRVCGKRFKDSTAVRAHERTHSDARPYACPRCDKTFKTSECLWHHENRSKTCGKSLGQLPVSRPGVGIKVRRGRPSRRSGRSQTHHHVFQQESKQVGDANSGVVTREIHTNFLPQQQPSIYISSVSPSVQFAEVVPNGSPDQPDEFLTQSELLDQDHSGFGSFSDQFAELAPTGAHHTASPDQPESGSFVNFDCSVFMDWDLSVRGPERPDHPVVKVEAAEMMDLLDYNLAAFNPPSDSLSSYPDIFDKVKVDVNGTAVEEVYDTDDEDHIDEEMCLELKQSQQQLLMHDVNGQQMTASDGVYQQQHPVDIDCQSDFSGCSTLAATPDGEIDGELVQRPYRCYVCRIGFKKQVHLKKHNLYKHSDAYPCQCGVCGKRFKDSSAVRLHERIHSTERPYSCGRCGKSFKTRENLWGHRHRNPCMDTTSSTTDSAVVCLPTSPVTVLNGTTTYAPYDDNKQKSVVDSDVVQVDFSIQNGSQWQLPSACVALEESRPSISTHLLQPSRSRVPATSSVMLAAQVPMAVVAPIKREIPDEPPLGAGLTLAEAKYSLPPFETLVTSHRSPEMTTSSPSSTSDKPATGVGVPQSVSTGVPSTVAAGVPLSPAVNVGGSSIRLPGIHQLFQTTSCDAGTGNSLSGISDESVRYTWSQYQLPATAVQQQLQQHPLQQQQLVQFFPKTNGDLAPDLPPPPPYPGIPSAKTYPTYARNDYSSFQAVLSSAARR